MELKTLDEVEKELEKELEGKGWMSSEDYLYELVGYITENYLLIKK